MNKIKRITALALMLIVVLGVSACGKPAEQAAAPAATAPVKTDSVEAYGVVKSADMHNINIDFPSSVSEVAVREGQSVKQGDVLITLDIKDYLAQIDTKQHELNAARLEITKLQNQIIESDASNSKEPDVKKLVNDLEYAKSIYDSSLKEQADKEKLYKEGVISKYDYEEFIRTVQDKKNAAEDLSYNLDITMHNRQIGNKELNDSISIQREKASVLEQEIAVMKEKLNKPYLKGNQIISDIEDGVITELGCIGGDIISPTQKALSIMNLNGMLVKANVSEEFIKDVKLGQRVEIIPVADKSKKFNGTVSMIASSAIEQNGETVIPVEISIDDNDSFLKPGYNVDVEIFY